MGANWFRRGYEAQVWHAEALSLDKRSNRIIANEQLALAA